MKFRGMCEKMFCFTNITLLCSLNLKPNTQNPIKTAGFERIRDVEGAEGGTSWNERREKFEIG